MSLLFWAADTFSGGYGTLLAFDPVAAAWQDLSIPVAGAALTAKYHAVILSWAKS